MKTILYFAERKILYSKTDESILLFDNVSEMKRYWSKNISELPKIIKMTD